MANPALPALALLIGAPAVVAMGVPHMIAADWAQLSIHERIIIHMGSPAGPPDDAAPDAAPTQWEEHGGPKCLALDSLDGAAITQPGSVDLILGDGSRMRADFDEDCPALDFYSGFYMRPTSDGKICADRDAIQSRSGGVCPIRSFHKLVAKH